MNDRKVTMQAIRYLSQVAEAIGFQAMNGTPCADEMARAIVRCADHVEHIAQCDIEEIDLESRMYGIADSMQWLILIVKQQSAIITASGLNVPSVAQLEAVVSAVGCVLSEQVVGGQLSTLPNSVISPPRNPHAS